MILGYTLNNIFAPIIFLWLFDGLFFELYKQICNIEVKDMAKWLKQAIFLN